MPQCLMGDYHVSGRILIAAGLALAFSGCATNRGARNRPPEPTAQPATLTPEQMSEDLDDLVRTIVDAHPNPYGFTGPRAFGAALARVREETGKTLSIDEFYIKAARLVACLEDGHTRLFPPDGWETRLNNGRVFPILLELDEGVVRLVGYYGEGEVPVGRPVLTIEGEAAVNVAERCAGCFPRDGREGDTEMLGMPGGLWYYLGAEYGSREQLTIEMQTTPETIGKYVVRALPISDALTRWRRPHVRTGPDAPLEYTYIADAGCGLITVRSFGNYGEVKFAKLLEDAFSDLKSRGADSLIIDVRECPGGNSGAGDVLLGYLTDKPFSQFRRYELKISKLCYQQDGLSPFFRLMIGRTEKRNIKAIHPRPNPLRFAGQVYVLIGPRSVSSSMSFAQAVKDYHLGTLVGAETGGMLNAYGNGLRFSLPNSHLRGQVASTCWVCAETAEGGRGAMPDYPVGTIQEELLSGRDAVLDAAIELIRSQRARLSEGGP